MRSDFLQKFKRITYSTNYLPEIDGLRFVALFFVVVIMHIPNYINVKFFNDQLIHTSYWRDFILEGNNGLILFFVISGFILSLPFARWRLLQGNPVQLKKYYLRRLTRLEIPYLIVLTTLFIAQAWIIHKYTLNILLPRFIASVFYLHTLTYEKMPLIMPVAWSLEVEVQFYLLAPLFCLIFLIRSRTIRWSILSVIILLNIYLWNDYKDGANVFVFLHMFCCGILLADLYCCKVILFKNQKLGLIIGIFSLIGLMFLSSLYNLAGYYFKTACLFLLMHTVLTNTYLKKAFSWQLIAIIGGMCYSIYLLHFAIISLVGELIFRSGITVNNKYYFIPFIIIFITVILVISSIYFLLIEKPFMKPIGLKKNSKHK